VIDYFSTAGNPDNRWGNSEKYVISIYIVDWVIINHVKDYFSTAENPDNRWGKQ
jgi:hypothetical protein